MIKVCKRWCLAPSELFTEDPGAALDLLALARRFGGGVRLDRQGAWRLAQDIAAALLPGDWLLLTGDLGAGKTTFVTWLLTSSKDSGARGGQATEAQGSADELVTSPTFALCHRYNAPQALRHAFSDVLHMDLYRLRSDSEMKLLGLDQLIGERTLVLVEWPEQVSSKGWQELWPILPCGAPMRQIVCHIGYPEALAPNAPAVELAQPDPVAQSDCRVYRIEVQTERG